MQLCTGRTHGPTSAVIECNPGSLGRAALTARTPGMKCTLQTQRPETNHHTTNSLALSMRETHAVLLSTDRWKHPAPSICLAPWADLSAVDLRIGHDSISDYLKQRRSTHPSLLNIHPHCPTRMRPLASRQCSSPQFRTPFQSSPARPWAAPCTAMPLVTL